MDHSSVIFLLNPPSLEDVWWNQRVVSTCSNPSQPSLNQIRALNRELRKLLVRGVEASVEANPSGASDSPPFSNEFLHQQGHLNPLQDRKWQHSLFSVNHDMFPRLTDFRCFCGYWVWLSSGELRKEHVWPGRFLWIDYLEDLRFRGQLHCGHPMRLTWPEKVRHADGLAFSVGKRWLKFKPQQSTHG